jgi:hypothetical protein
MRHCLAERYERSDRGGLGDEARRMRGAGDGLARLVQVVYVPADETSLLLFEAESADAIGEVARRAGLAVDRISEALVQG